MHTHLAPVHEIPVFSCSQKDSLGAAACDTLGGLKVAVAGRCTKWYF